jgi:homoserine kinase
MGEITAFAPASIGNLAVGFDIMGIALDYPGDEVVARLNGPAGVRITKMTGDGGKLPLETELNTAGMAVKELLAKANATEVGIELEVHKKLPLGSGMGSSAASAVAAVVAVNELLQLGWTKTQLLPFACLGEQVASGGFHADNVAPSLLGGAVLIRDNATLDVHSIPIPPDMHIVVVHPDIKILTKEARAILKPDISLKQHIGQSANLGAFIIGMFNNDYELLSRSLRDDVIEPQRAALIPGFYEVKQRALEQGALGCSISGAGPAIFALCANYTIADRVGVAMQRAFAVHQLTSNIYTGPVNTQGAILI